MIKKQILLFVATLTTALGYSQKELAIDYSYTLSNPYKVFDGHKYYFSENDQVMAVKSGGKKVIIQKFDGSNEKIKFLKEQIYDDFPGNMQVENVLQYNDKYYLFYSSWDGGKVNEERLFAREIDFVKGQFVGKGKLLFKVDGKVMGSPRAQLGFISIGVTDKFDILRSIDNKKMLIQYRKKPEVKSDKVSHDIIGMNSFDDNMNMTSSNEIEMPYTERRMDNLDYAIDAEGNMYILAKVYHDDSNKDKKSKKDQEANYHIELLRIKNGSKDIDITAIEVEDTFIHGLWLNESHDNYMICAGYYNGAGLTKGAKSRKGNPTYVSAPAGVGGMMGGGKVTSGDIDGIIVCKVTKDGSVHDMATYEIPIEVINEYVPLKRQRKNNKLESKGEAEFKDLKLSEVVIQKDGSLIIIGEQYYMSINTGVQGGIGIGAMNTNTSYKYYYNNLLVTKIDPSGELAWMKKIPKRQEGENSGKGGMSYKYIYANNNHYLLFLDNVKNYNLSTDSYPAKHTDGKGGYFTSYKINDATGTAVNSSVFNVRDMDDMTLYQFGQHRIVKISESTFAVEFYKKKKEDVMVKVEVK